MPRASLNWFIACLCFGAASASASPYRESRGEGIVPRFRSDGSVEEELREQRYLRRVLRSRFAAAAARRSDLISRTEPRAVGIEPAEVISVPEPLKTDSQVRTSIVTSKIVPRHEECALDTCARVLEKSEALESYGLQTPGASTQNLVRRLSETQRAQKRDVPTREFRAQETKLLEKDRPEESRRLKQSLLLWAEHTNARDIESLMTLYAPRLENFYLMTNVPASEVRSIKEAAFTQARMIEVTVEDPRIVFDPEKREARVFFRNRYTFDSRSGPREGKVLQELKWRNVGGAWLICGERDLHVVR